MTAKHREHDRELLVGGLEGSSPHLVIPFSEAPSHHSLGDPRNHDALHTTYAYDDAGRPERRTDPAGLTWAITYEPTTGRLDKEAIRNAADKLLAEFDPTFSAGGNVATMSQTIVKDPSLVTAQMTSAEIPAAAKNSESGTWAYGYDGASRLLSATQAGGGNASFTYDYDGGGNRIKTIAPRPDGVPAITITNFDSAGLATTETRGAFTQRYAYDVAGSLVSKETTGGSQDTGDKDYTYSYDPWGRMTRASLTETETSGTNTATYMATVDYTLDALGRTTQRTTTSTNPAVSTGTTTFALRGISEQIAKATTGASSVAYAYGAGGSPLAQGVTGSGRAEFFMKNTHGDVTGSVSTAANTTITGTVGYSPFGERRSGTGTMAPDTEKQANKPVMGFQGQPTDVATGLVDANTRMYDPSMGRFTTMDSVFGDLASPVSLNQYVYGNNNPVTMSDPSGMSAMSQYRAALRAYSAALVAWRTSLAAYNFYLNVALPDFQDRLESWNNLRPDMQAAKPLPTPPRWVPPPGPKPTPPALPPITVTSRAHIQEARSNILEAAREAAAVAVEKTRADARSAMETRRFIHPGLSWNERIMLAQQYAMGHPRDAEQMEAQWLDQEKGRIMEQPQYEGMSWNEIRAERNASVSKAYAMAVVGPAALSGNLNCGAQADGFRVCTGVPKPLSGMEGGWTIGNVYYTWETRAPGLALVSHEENHADWWAIMGPEAFSTSYFRLYREYGGCMFFEQAAGYESGRYSCP